MPTRVLIVEDDFASREALALLLRTEGYHTDVATDGRAALAYLRGQPTPALILLDLMMPVMDGWQFLAERRRDPLLAAVPVVVFTAASGIDARAVRVMGAEDVVHKPADPDDVLAAVRRHSGPAAGRTQTGTGCGGATA
jgi:CheY-like chemotaxis protein